MNILNFEYDKRFWQALRLLPFQDLEFKLKSSSESESENYLYQKLSPIVRKILGIPRFNKAEKIEVSKKILELTNIYLSKRSKRFARHSVLSQRVVGVDRRRSTSRQEQIDCYAAKMERIKKDYFKKVFATAERIFLSNYRQPESSWAGGETTVKFQVDREVGQTVSSYRVWSDNGKWSGSNLGGTINIQPNWYRQVYKQGIGNCQGLLTTHATKLKRCFWSATWIEQSRGMSLKLTTGFIYKSKGEYFHGNSEKSCKATAKRYFANLAKQRLNDAQLFLESGLEEYADLKVHRRLSVLAGNCDSGTENWLHLHGFGDRFTVSVKELYLADPKNPRVLAVIQYAIAGAKKKQLASA